MVFSKSWNKLFENILSKIFLATTPNVKKQTFGLQHEFAIISDA